MYLSFPNRFEMGRIYESSHEDHATEMSNVCNFWFPATNNIIGVMQFCEVAALVAPQDE
jgi:hypothetical protein